MSKAKVIANPYNTPCESYNCYARSKYTITNPEGPSQLSQNLCPSCARQVYEDLKDIFEPGHQQQNDNSESVMIEKIRECLAEHEIVINAINTDELIKEFEEVLYSGIPGGGHSSAPGDNTDNPKDENKYPEINEDMPRDELIAIAEGHDIHVTSKDNRKEIVAMVKAKWEELDNE